MGRARGFALTVLAILALGTAVAALVFNLTAWIVWFDLPHPHPEQLYLIGFKDKRGAHQPYQAAIQFQAYQESTVGFSEYAAVSRSVANAVVDGQPAVANLIEASSDCFHTLGVQPTLGRGFLPEEYRSRADRVVVISDLFWRKYFQADPAVLGRHILIDQQPCTVVGVLAVNQSLPPSFEGDVYQPLVFKPDQENPFGPVVFVIGRLKPEVPPDQARAALASVKLSALPPWAAAYLADQEIILMRPTEVARPEAFWIMAGAAALLYLIACFNATNLMLLRLLGRRREIAIRFSLGATRWQITRLLALESVTLALAATVLVTLAARWLFPPLLALITGSEAAAFKSYWDAPTLGCIGLLNAVACVTLVLITMGRFAQAEIGSTLKDGGTTAGESRRASQLRIGLVILQAAIAVILLAGAGLMMRSFERLYHSDLGFDPTGKVKVTISFPRDYNPNPEERLQLFERLQQRIATLPGVRAVSTGQDTLLEGGFWGTAQLIMPDGTQRPVAGHFVAADYFTTAGLTLKKGHWFSSKRGEYGVVINETFARTRFGGEDPIGKSFRLLVSGNIDQQVVGVVGDVKEQVRTTPGMHFYVANWVYPSNVSTLLLRMDRDPGKEFAGQIRRAVYQFEPKLIVSQVNSINEIVGNSMWAEHYAYKILKGLSLTALALATVGIFSVLSYTVNCRMKEFGVRLALGALPVNLYALVMKRSLLAAGMGILLGAVGALALTRFMQSLLFETPSYDPVTYLVTAALLLSAATLACILPARRAARVDATRLLKAE